MKAVLIKYFKQLGYLSFVVFLCLILLEISFRFQWIDFYQSELKGLNTTEQLISSEKDNVLVFGDSFSAHPDSYVKHLRNSFPEFNFINTAIPGTGIRQHELIFKKRINTYQPKAIIYQFYVGNDFTDIQHSLNFKKLSFSRNLFWKASEYLLILKYINRRLAFLNMNNQSIKKLHEDKFSKQNYNRRVKIQYQADKSALNNTLLLKGEKTKEIYNKWKEKLSLINKYSQDSISLILLIIPHNAQINMTNIKRNRILGAKLSPQILHSTYPLIEKIKNDSSSYHVINPLIEFQQIKHNDSLYYQNDPHLTNWGQKQLSKILLKKLFFEDE